jgi:uncharacterized protein
MQTKAIELNATTQGQGIFEARASVYNFWDYQQDNVLPGAFTASIKATNGKTKILNQHDPADVIGIGVLDDRPDALWVKGTLVLELPSAQAAWTRLVKGLIDACSIGYTVVREQMTREGRLLKELDLAEISLVTFPANALSRITALKQRGDQDELRGLLTALKSANVAYRTAKDQEDARALRDVLTGLRLTRIGINLDRLIDSL